MEIFFPAIVALKGTIQANPSKSYMQRALALTFLTKGTTVLHRPCFSKDSQAVLQLLIDAGVVCSELTNEKIILTNQNKQKIYQVNCGESGLFLRMFVPIFALFEHSVSFFGTGSLLQRDLKDLENFCKKIGLTYTDTERRLPVMIQGPLHPQNTQLGTLESSQYLSGLLMALPLLEKESFLFFEEIKSSPYIALTISLMQKFGVYVETLTDGFHIPGQQTYKPAELTVEGDWSGTAFWIAAALIAAKEPVAIEGLNPHSLQADQAILQLAKEQNWPVHWFGATLYVHKMDSFPAFTFNATLCPDLFPVLALLACFAKGESCITGLHRLHNKESNRENAILKTLQGVGVQCSAEQDNLKITGQESVSSTLLSSYNDHRIAMLAALLSLRAVDGIMVKDFDAIDKSYPNFLDHYFQLTN